MAQPTRAQIRAAVARKSTDKAPDAAPGSPSNDGSGNHNTTETARVRPLVNEPTAPDRKKFEDNPLNPAMLKGMSYEEFLKHWNSGGGHISHRIGNRVYGEKQNTMEEQALADLHATTVRLRALGKEPKIHFDVEKQRAVVHFDNTVLDFCFTEKCAAELERELSHIRGLSNGAIRGEAPLKSIPLAQGKTQAEPEPGSPEIA